MLKLENEIRIMLDMTDEDRLKHYGTLGWKRLIERYMECVSDALDTAVREGYGQ